MSQAGVCKVCGGPTSPFGAVDFNKSCLEGQGKRLAPVGVEVPYERCGGCGLIFTRAFDTWSVEDFQERIYGEGYLEVDPEYVEKRPTWSAGLIHDVFGPKTTSLRVLDYGGGNGRFAELLRAKGWSDVTTYDPFNPTFAVRPEGRFDLVTCFETMEHMSDPRAGAADLDSFLRPEGVLVFSTLVQPPDIEQQGLSWWYAAPRNGHITLFSHRALSALWEPLGVSVMSAGAAVHAGHRAVIPAWARHIFPKR